jgi:hypothetical protein
VRRKNKGESTASAEEPWRTYKTSYRGGLAHLPKAKVGEVRLEVYPDRFEFQPTIGSKKFWTHLVMPYETITDLKIVDRTVSTVEGLLGGLNSRQLNQKNIILIAYADGQQLRMEMITGVTVMGQAKVCLEFEDLLRTQRIYDRFASAQPPPPPPPPPGAAANAPSELALRIRELGELRDQGLLTDEEFYAQKAKLLG